MVEKREIPTEGNWYLIMVSWEAEADKDAVKRFHQVYKYLNIRAPRIDAMEREIRKKEYNGFYEEDLIMAGDPVDDIVEGTLMPLNLIGRRKFVIILQTPSSRVLQRLSKMISLYVNINVEIFPATHVHDLIGIMPPKETLSSK
jgi:hypothetical protein